MSAALLLSGGLDSIAVAYWKRPDLAITIDYGQIPAPAEIRASQEVAGSLAIRHEIVRADCRALGSGDLAGSAPHSVSPVPEWWPFRNQLLVTLAAMAALRCNVEVLLIGSVASDAAHADGTSEFVSAMSGVLNIQEGALRLEAPAIAYTSPDLIRMAGVPAELLCWGHSCHVAEFACGTCRGCNKHYQTMESLGIGPF